MRLQFVFVAFGIADVGPGSVERGDAGGVRGVDRGAAGVAKLDALFGASHADADGVIFAADADADQALGGGADFVGVGDGVRVLDPGGDLDLPVSQAAGALEEREVIVDALDVASGLDLGDADAVEPGLDDGVEFLLDETGVVAVCAHEEPPPAFGEVGQDATEQLAGGGLVVPGDGVFEVEAKHVSLGVAGFLDESLANAWHGQH